MKPKSLLRKRAMATSKSPIRELTVKTWSELVSELYDNSYNETLDRFRSPYAFRGITDLNYKLETTLVRLGHSTTDEIRFIEARLLENFKKYAYGQFDDKLSIWHWISVGQHHGLPTRLLDWTYSPFVA